MPDIAYGALVAAMAALVQGCTGFGLALIGAPLLMLLFPPQTVPPTIILLSTVNTAYVAWDARRHIDFRLVGPLALGALIGIPMGVWTLRTIDVVWLKVFVGAFVVLFSIVLLSGWKRPLRSVRWWKLAPIGTFSGFLGGSTSMGGPPVVFFLANQGARKDAFRATLVCYFVLINCYAVGWHTWSGTLTWSVLQRMLLLLPAMLAGSYVGVRLSRVLPEVLFKRVAMLLAALAGLGLLLRGVGELC